MAARARDPLHALFTWNTIAILLGLPGIVCGVWGSLQVEVEGKPFLDFWGALYGTIQLFLLDGDLLSSADSTPPLVQVARYLCGISSAALLYGVGARLLRPMFWEGWYRIRGEHTLILGPGELSESLAEKAKAKDRVVFVCDKRHEPAVRRMRRLGVAARCGDLDDPEFLKVCNARSAKRLLAVSESDDDNLNFAATYESLLGDDEKPADQKAILRLGQGPSGLSVGTGLFPNFDVVQLDPVEHRIRELFREHPPVFELPAGSQFENGAPVTRPYLIVVGDGRAAEKGLAQGARLAHYQGLAAPRLLWCATSQEATAKFLTARPALHKVLNLRIEHCEPGSAAMRKLLVTEFDAAYRTRELVTVLVEAGESVTERLATAQWMQELIPSVPRGSEMYPSQHVRLLVDLEDREELACTRRTKSYIEDYPNVQFCTIPGIGHRLGLDLTPREEYLAQAFHDRYTKARRSKHADRSGPPRPAEREWRELAETFRRASRATAEHLPTKLRGLGLELAPKEDPRPSTGPLEEGWTEPLAELEHRRWMVERALEGWALAEPRNDRLRHHDLLKPWDELSPGDKWLDKEFITWLDDVAEQNGMKIVAIPGKLPGSGGNA